MPRHSPPLLLVLLACLAPAFSGCGDDSPAPASPPEDATGATPPFPGETIPPETLLKRLHDRVASGAGSSDDTWGRDVAQVAMSLWPPAAGAGEAGQDEYRRLHTALAHVAGTTTSDAPSVAIHDAFLAASAQGVDVYRAWVRREGAELYRLLEADRQRLFEDRPR